MPTGPADDEAAYAETVRKYGFRRIYCSDNMPAHSGLLDDETKGAVIRNIQILKSLPSEIKCYIIRKYVQNNHSDFLGLRYSDLCPSDTHSKLAAILNILNQQNQHFNEKPSNWKKEPVISLKKRPLGFSEYGDDEQGKKDQSKRPMKKKRNKEVKRIVADDMPVHDRPPPELPAQVRNKIRELNGTEENLVITKQLYWSDVCRNNNRFSLPLKQINDNFLRAEERKMLKTRIGGKVPEIEVRLLQEGGKVTKLSLRRWDMFKTEGKVTSTYNLVGKWCAEVVETMKLREGMMVQLWSFRVAPTALWFALVIVTAN